VAGGAGSAEMTVSLALMRSGHLSAADLSAVAVSTLRATDVVQRHEDGVLVSIGGPPESARVALARLEEAVGHELDIELRGEPDGRVDDSLIALLDRTPDVRPHIPALDDPARAAVTVVVEDDDEVTVMLKALLELEGWSVLATSDADRGVELCKQAPADVLVCDYMLDGQSSTGADVARRCRQAGLGLPVIFFTASAAHDVIGEAGAVGASVIRKSEVARLISEMRSISQRLRAAHRR
jgi:CheY-like chemotaxis protein